MRLFGTKRDAAISCLLWLSFSILGARPAVAGISARYGGRLTVALPEAPFTLDPARLATLADRIAADLVFETLFRLSPEGTPLKNLAFEYQISDDALVYTIKLRPFLKFHDGSKLTAEDVSYSFKRLLDPRRPSPHAWLLYSIKGAREYSRGSKDSIEGIETPNDITIVFHLAERDPYFLQKLAALPTAIVPSGIDTRRRVFGRRPIGNGPFEFMGFTSRGSVELKAWNGHFKGRPYLDIVELLPPGSPSANVSVDHSARVPPPTSVVETMPWRTVILEPGNRLDLGKPGVRKALYSLLDRKTLAEKFAIGRYRIGESLLPFVSGTRDFTPMGTTSAIAALVASEVPSRLVVLTRKYPPRMVELARTIGNILEKAGLHPEVHAEYGTGFLKYYNLQLYDLLLGTMDPWFEEPDLKKQQLLGEYNATAARELSRTAAMFSLFMHSTSVELMKTVRDLAVRPDGTMNLENVWTAPFSGK